MVFQHNKNWHCLKMLHNVPVPSQLFQEFGVCEDILTPGEECECGVSFQPVMSALSHSQATDTCMLPCSSSENEKEKQSDSVVFLKHQLKTLSIHPQVLQSDGLILTLHLLASGSSHAAWSSSMCSPSSVGWPRLLSISVTDGEGAGLTLPWSQLQ